MKIEATDEEVAALHQLLHRAVLHSGMDAAEAACLWKQKLIRAAQQKEQTSEIFAEMAAVRPGMGLNGDKAPEAGRV
jgi:hypothetical protein